MMHLKKHRIDGGEQEEEEIDIIICHECVAKTLDYHGIFIMFFNLYTIFIRK
jgi:hypothetical protein